MDSHRKIAVSPSQVMSCTNTPVMQRAKQMHIERRCVCEVVSSPGSRAGYNPRVRRFFSTQVQLLFCLELPRKGSAKGSGIRDAQVKAYPVN